MASSLRTALVPALFRPRPSQQFNFSPRRFEFHSTALRREHFLNVNTETFRKAISKERAQEKVVLVDFYADWCQPCRMLSPILEKLTTGDAAKSGTGKALDLVTVDTDAETELAQKYEIRSLPTVIAFKDGEPVDQFIGALNEAGVRKFLTRF